MDELWLAVSYCEISIGYAYLIAASFVIISMLYCVMFVFRLVGKGVRTRQAHRTWA